jgi:hypothetical protein
VRGAIFLSKDLHERAVPVDITLPREFHFRALTNPDEIAGSSQMRVWLE